MAPTILIAGATGNTGQAVVETLSKAFSSTSVAPGQRILALTRSSRGETAQHLAALPGVEVSEKNWVDITADWLREQNVKRAFIAPHNQPNQFAEESAFHLAAVSAGVEYVVRISTGAANVRPDSPSYYGRAHWAIEELLASAPFSRLRWTSLQPNIFSTAYLASAAEFVREYRKTGRQAAPLRLIASKEAPVGTIHPKEIGVFAARLLLEEDVTKHNRAKYVLNGPEDITGEQIVKLVEGYIGAPVEDIKYKDVTFIDQLAAMSPPEGRNLILAVKPSVEPAWNGMCTTSTTSKEVLELAPPKLTPAAMLQAMVDEKA